jgi:hypothetical protein
LLDIATLDLLQHCLGGRSDPGDRRAQLVGGVGDETTGPFLGGLRLRLGAFQRVEHHVERRRGTPQLGVGACRRQPAAPPAPGDLTSQHCHRIQRRQREPHPYPQHHHSHQQGAHAGEHQDPQQPRLRPRQQGGLGGQGQHRTVEPADTSQPHLPPRHRRISQTRWA